MKQKRKATYKKAYSKNIYHAAAFLLVYLDQIDSNIIKSSKLCAFKKQKYFVPLSFIVELTLNIIICISIVRHTWLYVNKYCSKICPQARVIQGGFNEFEIFSVLK